LRPAPKSFAPPIRGGPRLFRLKSAGRSPSHLILRQGVRPEKQGLSPTSATVRSAGRPIVRKARRRDSGEPTRGHRSVATSTPTSTVIVRTPPTPPRARAVENFQELRRIRRAARGAAEPAAAHQDSPIAGPRDFAADRCVSRRCERGETQIMGNCDSLGLFDSPGTCDRTRRLQAELACYSLSPLTHGSALGPSPRSIQPTPRAQAVSPHQSRSTSRPHTAWLRRSDAIAVWRVLRKGGAANDGR